MGNVAITGWGAVTKFGSTKELLWNHLVSGPQSRSLAEYSLNGFDAAPHLTNKRVLRSVSWYHGFGLAAVELCKKNSNLAAHPIAAPAFGIYVGAPPSSMYDNTNYIQPVLESKGPDGTYSEKNFGSTCMNTLGTTLLLGLPNNVLCYGSMILNAKGPNSNYVSGDTSGLIALCNGAWKISDGKLKAAVVGGYSMSSDPVIMSMLKKQGLLHNDDQSDASITIGKNAGTIPADGSVFMLLESEESAKERESKILARFLSSGTSFSGRLRYLNQTSNTNEDSDAMLQAIEQCLKQAHAQNGLELKDVGLICMSGSGVSYIDDAEINAVSSLSAKVGRDIPAISISPKFGNLMESSGLLEVCLAKDMLSKSAELPPELFLKGKKLAIDPAKRVALVLRSSLAGDKVCIAFEIPID